MEVKCFVQGEIETNCYVVSDETKNCVVIDCDGNIGSIARYITNNGLTLTHILLTHGHHDHIGSVNLLREKYNCTVCINKRDEELLGSASKNYYDGKFEAVLADCYLKEGDIVKSGNMTFSVMETPGHTKGGVCYITEGAVFSGDTLFAGDCGRTDLYGGDWEEMKQSLKRLHDLEGDYAVYPGHGPSSTLKEERIVNQYMKQSL